MEGENAEESMKASIQEAIIAGGVASDDIEKFYVWAFGEDWETIPMSSAGDRWNERHGETLTVKGTDPRISTMIKMAKLYVETHYG